MSETLEPALPDHLDQQAERLMHRLCDARLTVASSESCTGGMFAALLTDIEDLAGEDKSEPPERPVPKVKQQPQKVPPRTKR